MREDVLACYPRIDPARVEVIPNGIDADQYHPDPETGVLARHGIDPGRPYVLFVGRITRQKGLTHLLNAARADRPGRPAGAVRGRARHRGAGLRGGRQGREPGRAAWRHPVDPRDGPAACRGPAHDRRVRVLLPIGVRALRDRDPGGHGLRGPGRGHGHRRHSRCGRGRGDGAPRAVRAQRGSHGARRSRPIRGRPRPSHQRAAVRSRSGRGDGKPAAAACWSGSRGVPSPIERSTSTAVSPP
jgi:hypothetical protein